MLKLWQGSAVIRDLILRVLEWVTLGILEVSLWILDGIQWLLGPLHVRPQEPDRPDLRTSDVPWYMQEYWPVYMDVDLRIIHDESSAFKARATALATKIRAKGIHASKFERDDPFMFSITVSAPQPLPPRRVDRSEDQAESERR